jgi:hypothetical protein
MLDGKALPLNPGPHTFHFEAGGGVTLNRQVVTKEGEKNLPVAVVLAAAPDPSAPFFSTPLAPAQSPGGRDTLEILGLVGAGTGAAALAIGTVAGFVAIADKNSAHCDANHGCDPGPLGDARTAADVADVGLISGALLAAGGLGLVLFAPHSSHQGHAASMTIAPVVARTAGGLVVGGVW